MLEDSKTLVTTVQNLVAPETWRPGFVTSVLMYLVCYIIVRLKFISTFCRTYDLLMLIMEKNTTATQLKQLWRPLLIYTHISQTINRTDIIYTVSVNSNIYLDFDYVHYFIFVGRYWPV